MSEAERAIQGLVYGYADRIDRGDFERVAELFANAVITTEGSPHEHRGRDAVLKLYRGTTRIYPETGTPQTHHVTTNLILEIDESAGIAEGRSYYTVFQQTDQLALQPIITGRYHDRFERHGEWRFAARHIYCDLFGDLSQHLLIDTSLLEGK